MPEGRKVGETIARTFSFSSLTFMMPRQVMLSVSSNSKSNSSKAAPPLTPEQRKLLLEAVCQFLELNGFSKTLKKFLSEAELEKDSSKNSLYNLEDMCSQYLVTLASSDGDDKDTTKLDKESNEIVVEANGTESIASKDKAKKEKKKQSETHSKENDESSKQNDDNLKSKEKKKKKSSDDSIPVVEDAPLEDAHEKSSKKSKSKKKSKSGPDSAVENLEQKQGEGLVKEEKKDVEKSSKSKSEKKKKTSSAAETVEGKSCDNKQGDDTKDSVDCEDGMKKEKKSSKKRKRNLEENDAEELKESKTNETETTGSKDEDNDMVDAQTPAADKQSNGFLEQNGGDKSTGQKSSKKQKTGSTEPKSLNAFRRVDPEKVVIEDERLQDNSYWAKNGADSGYGAKAQEVLGQVRGRDFRHEKTKKKRGSYRGGQIDLDSHSIKYYYSEEDE